MGIQRLGLKQRIGKYKEIYNQIMQYRKSSETITGGFSNQEKMGDLERLIEYCKLLEKRIEFLEECFIKSVNM